MSVDDASLRQRLSRTQYEVTQCGATEPPFSGDYIDDKRRGTYRCICCGQALFHADTQYDSGTGWPSFYQPVAAEAVGEQSDHALGMARTEIHCGACSAHLGHVFDDGPQPTGLRYCVNSAALELEPDGQ